MTATTETRLVGTGAALLPRVNLLPPEIGEKRAFRKVQIGLGSAVLAAVGIVGLLYVSAAGSVDSAQGSLDTATSRQGQLQVETTKYAAVTGVYARAAAAQAMLGQAMSDEVRYSQLLNDLSLSVPAKVWVKNVTYAQTAAGAPAAGAVTSATPGVGTLTVSGVGFSHDDVAVWLESIAGQKTYSNPYASNSSEVLLGTRKVVNFASTATVTSAALSGRYTKPAGG